jgi:hypothetical protein
MFSEFTSHIGYRFALTTAPAIPPSIARGSALSIQLEWINQGNAPIYRPYRLVIRLVSAGVEIARGSSAADIRTWMPFSEDGAHFATSITLPVPSNASTGAALVQVALVDPTSGLPAIRFAMQGGNPDLWYDIGTVSVD